MVGEDGETQRIWVGEGRKRGENGMQNSTTSSDRISAAYHVLIATEPIQEHAEHGRILEKDENRKKARGVLRGNLQDAHGVSSTCAEDRRWEDEENTTVVHNKECQKYIDLATISVLPHTRPM